MLPFGVTIPATVPQGSEIPEGLMNNPVYCWAFVGMDNNLYKLHGTYIKIVLMGFVYELIIRKHTGMSNLKKIQPTSSHSTSLRTIWIFSAHLSLGLPNGLFPQSSAIELLWIIIVRRTYHILCLSHSRDVIAVVIYDEDCLSWCLSLCSALHLPVNVYPLRLKYFPHHLVSNIISLYSPFT